MIINLIHTSLEESIPRLVMSIITFSGNDQNGMLDTDIQGKIYFLIRWAHNLSSLRTSHCEGVWAPAEKAEQRKHCSRESLKTDVPDENTCRRAHALSAGHSLDCSQCGRGSRNTLGKECWVWHEVTAVYPSGELGPGQETQHLAHSRVLSRKSKN